MENKIQKIRKYQKVNSFSGKKILEIRKTPYGTAIKKARNEIKVKNKINRAIKYLLCIYIYRIIKCISFYWNFICFFY